MHIFALGAHTWLLAPGHPLARGVSVVGADGRIYGVAADFGSEPIHIAAAGWLTADEVVTDIVTGEPVAEAGFQLQAGQVRVFLAEWHNGSFRAAIPRTAGGPGRWAVPPEHRSSPRRRGQ